MKDRSPDEARRIYLVTFEGLDEKLVAEVTDLAERGGFSVARVDEKFDAAWVSHDPKARLVSRRSDPPRSPRAFLRLVADVDTNEGTLEVIRELCGVGRVESLPAPIPPRPHRRSGPLHR